MIYIYIYYVYCILYNLYATYNYLQTGMCVCVCQGFWDHGVQVAYKSYNLNLNSGLF